MKKVIILIIIFTLTGCNSYTELNSLGVIHSIGIEKKDSYKLTVSILESNEINSDSLLYEVYGSTIPDIMDKLSLTLDYKIYLSHLDLLIIDESIKENDLKEIINFFLNNKNTRTDFLVVTAKDIKEILKNSDRKSINNLIKINEETSKSIYTTMFDLMEAFFMQKPIYLTNIILEDKIKINGVNKLYHNKKTLIKPDQVVYINYLLNNIGSYKSNLKCKDDYIYFNVLSSNTNEFNNKILITNEINITKNNCNLTKKDFNTLFNESLKENIKDFTNKNIIIQNTIRGDYEAN